MDKKSPSESTTEIQRLVLPADTNIFNALYGGRLMEWIDNVASIVAIKHCRRRVVTGSIDSLFFLSPIHMGDIVLLQGTINHATKSTMEIEVDVYSEEGLTGTRNFTTKAFLTSVAVDQSGKPTEIPQLLLETEEEKKRFNEGERRSKERLALLSQIRKESKKA